MDSKNEKGGQFLLQTGAGGATTGGSLALFSGESENSESFSIHLSQDRNMIAQVQVCITYVYQ